MTIPDRARQEAVDSLDMTGHFALCSPVEMKLITKVHSSYIELKLWFSPKTINRNCDKRLLSC